MAGYDLKSDQTQTFVYACLTGIALNGVVKQFGIKFVLKSAQALVNKVPGKVLIAINKKVGFRLITKAGTFSLLMDGKLANLVVTDPPYNVNYEGSAGKIKNDNRTTRCAPGKYSPSLIVQNSPGG